MKNRLIGRKIGRLTVIKKSEDSSPRKIRYVCLCDCGNTKIISGNNLGIGRTESCGCLWRERVKNNGVEHGLSRTRIHKVWSGMIERCSLKSAGSYLNYGGRGISVCEEWKNFIKFYEWAMENGYSDDLTLDRIDVNGNYEPGNCRWATHIQQSNNRRNNRFIECNGVIHTEAEWSRMIGGGNGTVSRRLKHGWSIEDAVTVKAGTIRNNQYTKKRS